MATPPVSKPIDPNAPIRLNRYLAQQGIATRREADTLITQGRVLVNNVKAVLGMKVTPTDKVTLSAKNPRRLTYLAYYKPRGIITHSPQENKERAITDIMKTPGVFPIGRLDKASEGLIILTNDGRVTERLLHPRFAHEKEYVVEVQEVIDPSKLHLLEAGIMDDDELLTAKKVTKTDKQVLTIILTEGKKHQIRRMLDAICLTVVSLKRTRIMAVNLGSLKPGQSRPLTGLAREAFLKDLGLE